MSEMTIILPSLGQEIEAGLAAFMNAPLPDEKKLPILIQDGKIATVTMVKSNAVIWGLSQFNQVAARELFLNGIAAAIDLGLICTHAGTHIPDGNWKKSSIVLPISQEEKTTVERLITREKMKAAVSIIVATKANYWMMNHQAKELSKVASKKS